MSRRTETGIRRLPLTRAGVCLGIAIALTTGARAAAQTTDRELAEMSLEDLMNVQVTSVSKRAERLGDTAASVYVLTNDDIRRSGAVSIPDALRLVPGLHVGQIDVNGWSISVRGFGGRFANKLLVLIDGQSIYSPLFSGVHWSMVNVPIDEIDRIEVVRGPGATLWGANAVNGVINIITRAASSSQGVLVTTETGSTERAGGSFRYGGQVSTNANYRVDANGFSRRGTTASNTADPESWEGGRVGARVDAQLRSGDRLTLIGGSVVTRADETYLVPEFQPPYSSQANEQSRHTTSSILGRWTRTADRGETTLQVEAGHTSFEELVLDERRRTFGVELQQTQHVGARQELIWGATYLNSTDRIKSSSVVRIEPARQTLHLWSGFIQDDVSVRGDAVRLTVGSKLEHNDYTGWEIQPNARVRVALPKRQALWASVSRAVRLPNRAETSAHIEPLVLPPSVQVPLPQLLSLRRGASISSENLRAYEVGYRVRPAATLSIDASGFLNDYHGLLGNHPGTPFMELSPVPHLIVPVLFDNTGTARVAGGEVSADWRPSAQLRLQGGYSRFAWLEGQPRVEGNAGQIGDYPGHQMHVRGSALLPGQVEVDTMARYVSDLELSGVPSYFALDARVGVRVGPIDVSVVGRNLAGPEHCEYLPDVLYTTQTSVQRSVGLRLRWQF